MSAELLTTDEAFLSAETPKVLPPPPTGGGGPLELKAFTSMRQAVALDLGVGDPNQNEFTNAIVTAWLCTLEPREVLRARVDREAALEAAFGWADAQGWSIARAEPLLELYRKINAELFASTQARLEHPGGSPQKNGGGPPEPLNPPPPSPKSPT